MPLNGDDNLKNPFYIRLSQQLICIILILLLMVLGKSILIPLTFAGILTLVLSYPCNLLEKARLPRSLAAGICLILFLLLAGWIVYFISSQVAGFRNDIPQLNKQFSQALIMGEKYLHEHWHISHHTVLDYLGKLQSWLLSNSSLVLGSTFATVTTVVIYTILVPIYTFLMLIYRDVFVRFLEMSFAPRYIQHVHAIVWKTKFVIQRYVLGLFIEMVVVAILICSGMFIIGVKYALLLGVLAAVLNLIPYLGIFTAIVISFLVTVSTNNISTAFISLVLLWAVHIVDSNILLPKIVGGQVKMNALVTIVAVIVGEEIWGIPGMFLSIPIVAILKVIFDNVNSLKPWGYILGEGTKRKKTAQKAVPEPPQKENQ